MNKLIYRINSGKAQHCCSDMNLHLNIGETLIFDIESGGSWYGHGFAHRQPYPLNRESLINERFAVNNIQAPIWLASNGFAILAKTNESLKISFNEGGNGLFSISCHHDGVDIRIWAGKHLPEAHLKLMTFLGWPPPVPEKSFIGDTLFCTWTQYPRAISQARILEMAQAIRSRDFPCSTLIIDDRWESGFGELTFSKDFPDPIEMVASLHKLGFKVLLWVTPFINEETANFKTLAEKGLLVMTMDKTKPSLLKWWGGCAGLVDLTNPEARKWYKDKLLDLKNNIGIDGFKIDGGDAKYQPDPMLSKWHCPIGDSGYSNLLLELFEEIAPNNCESRTAWLSQNRKIIWREGGKDSHWGLDNGLQAMVTLGLHLSLMGYDTLIPDMVPGRVQTMISSLPLPTDELFIRWTEASAFFPLFQFSYFPWNYSEPTSAIAKKFAMLHKNLEDYLLETAENRKVPILRPLWYDEPDRKEFYSVNDQFLLGRDLLIAPVLNEHQLARDIVLPSGLWKDAWTGKCFRAKRISMHPAPCPGIPVFVKATNNELYETINSLLKTIKMGSIISGKTSATWQCGLDRNIKITG